MVKKTRKQLNRQQVFVPRSFKGEENGRHRYFEYLRDIYKDDAEVLADIDKMESMQRGVDSVETPAAHDKTEQMFYKFMDDFNQSIGYTAEDSEK